MMMKILGIIAEYDPFHRGHARHLRLAKEQVQPDFTYVILSGCLKQRGELSLLSPYDRARCALEYGADAVFTMPAAWTVQDAEHYALGGVSLLKDLGATHLAFGAETGDLNLLQSAAEMLEKPDDFFEETLRGHLKAGLGYPKALSMAMGETQPELAAMMEKPNNILAICYLRAMDRLIAGMEPVVIPRGGAYHADRIRPEEPSASAIREALRRGDYAHAYAAVPQFTEDVLRRAFLSERIPREEILDQLMIRRLREMSREELAALPDVSEGLEDRIAQAARQARTRRELLDLVSGKRYPRARISRICVWAMMGVTARTLSDERLPSRAVLLGLREKREMTSLWKNKGNLVTAKWTNEIDLAAWKLWAQCAGQPDTLPWTEKVARLSRDDE